MMFDCLSVPFGGFDDVAPGDSDRSYLHIVRVLLDAATGTPIDVLLQGEGITNILQLQNYLKRPGLADELSSWEHTLDGESMTLSGIHHKDLTAIGTYLTRIMKNFPHIDITSRTCDDFDLFVGFKSVPKKPTVHDNDKAHIISMTKEALRNTAPATTTTDRPAPATTATGPTSTKCTTVTYTVIRPPPPTFTPLADEPLMIAEKMWDRPDKTMTAATTIKYGEPSLCTGTPPTPGRMKDTDLIHKTVAATDPPPPPPRQIHTATASCLTDTISIDRSGKTMDAEETLTDTGEQPSLLTNAREMKFMNPSRT